MCMLSQSIGTCASKPIDSGTQYVLTQTHQMLVTILLFLPLHLQGAALDSLLDDSVSMAQRLKSAKQLVTLNVIDNLPHGFLSLVTTGNNTDYNNALKLCVDYMKGELGIALSPRSARK